MKLYIVRHGETTANVDDVLQGQLPGALNDLGYKQAELIAKTLKDIKFDIILSSDLKRAKDTADEIAKFHTCPYKTNRNLRERHFGVYQGKDRTPFYESERGSKNPYLHKPKEGESFTDLYNRAKKFLNKLEKEYSTKVVLLVSHGDITRMILGVLLGKDVEGASQVKQSNACINILEVGKNLKSKVVELNSTEHLGEFVSHNPSEI